MNAAEFDNTTTQQQKQKRTKHRLYVPRPDDFAPKELDDLALTIYLLIALNGVMSTAQVFIYLGIEDNRKEQDLVRLRLE
jgi:hypothetical protein